MNDQIAKKILEAAEKLEGTVIKTDNASSNMSFVSKARDEADKYEWLYHCTTSEALLSIISKKEFWLKNLKLVNDKEEAERIDVPEYEKSYYIACFTCNDNIPEEHWKEYGNMKNGILIGVKKEWFLKKADFLCECKVVDEDFFRIHKNRENALNFKIENQKTRLCNPFYINSKGFYKVVYDDELVKNIRGNTYIETDSGKISGYSFTPEVAGIIKSTHGLCKRDGQKEYVKDWTSENEVRLKVGIQQLSNSKNGYEIHDGMVMDEAYFPMIRIILSDKAFEIIRIRFSPDFVNKNEFIEKIKNVLPNSKIELLE